MLHDDFTVFGLYKIPEVNQIYVPNTKKYVYNNTLGGASAIFSLLCIADDNHHYRMKVMMVDGLNVMTRLAS